MNCYYKQTVFLSVYGGFFPIQQKTFSILFCNIELHLLELVGSARIKGNQSANPKDPTVHAILISLLEMELLLFWMRRAMLLHINHH